MNTWKKVPSVRSGGKAYFYVRLNGYRKTTVMWDRQSKTWGISKNDILVTTGYKTSKSAMKAADK